MGEKGVVAGGLTPQLRGKETVGFVFGNIRYQKSKQPNQKVGKRPKQTFLLRRHKDG